MQVALTALSLYSSVVAPSASDPKAPAQLWVSSWEVMCTTATAFATEATRAHVSVRQRFVQTFATMHLEGKARISNAAYEGMLALLAALVAHPVAGGEMWPPTYVPPLQTALVACLPDFLPPQDSPRRWTMLLVWLCDQLQLPPDAPAPSGADGAASAAHEGDEGATGESDSSMIQAHAGPEEDAGEQDGGDAVPLDPAGEASVVAEEPVKKVLGLESEPMVRKLWIKTMADAAVGIVKAHMPWEVRGEALRRLAVALRGGIALRWAPAAADTSPLAAGVPQALVQAFVALVEHGLPGVHYTAGHAGAAATEVR